MRISLLTALAALAAPTALGGCVATVPATTTYYGYNYPSPYYNSYTVTQTYPYWYSGPYSTAYNVPRNYTGGTH
jgi:hypothetical protein